MMSHDDNDKAVNNDDGKPLGMTGVNEKSANNQAECTGTNTIKQRRIIDKWLNQTLRLELIDGRIILGRLVCTDNHPNIIMINSQEFWHHKEQEFAKNNAAAANANKGKQQKFQCRDVGLILVKGEHIRRIFLIKPRNPPAEEGLERRHCCCEATSN